MLNSGLSVPTLDAPGSEILCEYKSNPTASHTQQSFVAIFSSCSVKLARGGWPLVMSRRRAEIMFMLHFAAWILECFGVEIQCRETLSRACSSRPYLSISLTRPAFPFPFFRSLAIISGPAWRPCRRRLVRPTCEPSQTAAELASLFESLFEVLPRAAGTKATHLCVAMPRIIAAALQGQLMTVLPTKNCH